MQISNIKKLTTTFPKKFNHEFLPIVERERERERERVSLLIGNLNYCIFDTIRFNVENNESLCRVA